ncbi:endonuclease/exonuclease/phosphatase [Nemorincola caseinilytica]
MILAILSVTVCYAASAQQKLKVIAIGSYNCENLFDTVDDTAKKDEDFTPNGAYSYTQEVYTQKLHNIATVLEKIGTDVTPDGAAVIGLVEIENSTVLADLVAQKEIKHRNYKYCWFPTPDERGISTAMLYNPKYFKLIAAETLPVPLETIGQKRPTRAVLHVYGVLAGDTVHILVNHWPSKSGGEARSAPGRMLAAKVNKHLIDSLMAIRPDTRILLMGDLNDNPTGEPVKEVLQAKADKDDVTMKDLFNPWINIYKKGMGTESYRGEWGLIDQIMLSGSFVENNTGWRYYRAEIFNKEFLTNKLGKDKGLPHRSFTIAQVWDNGYSDHFPVLVYLVKNAD